MLSLERTTLLHCSTVPSPSLHHLLTDILKKYIKGTKFLGIFCSSKILIEQQLPSCDDASDAGPAVFFHFAPYYLANFQYDF